MTCILKTFNLELVQETSKRYDVPKTINSQYEAFKAINSVYNLSNKSEECVIMMTLDVKKKMTGFFVISIGNLSSSIVHPREVFKRAMLMNADGIIIAHNHPSGDCTPSQKDIEVSQKLKEVGKIIGIELVDHLIVGNNKFESLKSKGVI